MKEREFAEEQIVERRRKVLETRPQLYVRNIIIMGFSSVRDFTLPDAIKSSWI